MLSEELRTLTASEPLTLAEEYAMQGMNYQIVQCCDILLSQEKWREDEDKLTFIALARAPDVEIPTEPRPTDPWTLALPMIGDVNMFLRGTPSTTPNDAEDDDPFEAEVEVMIAGTH
ncbi:hypothetical protein BD779DRAFT_1587952 [Infundibulicybe gibba]|nr:hypothetical protein BD779DRAFT_1587952 [Infundibulicybe gibba]